MAVFLCFLIVFLIHHESYAKSINLKIDSDDVAEIFSSLMSSDIVKRFAEHVYRRTSGSQITLDNPFHPEDKFTSIQTPSKSVSSVGKRKKKHKSMLRKTAKEISDILDKENESFDGHISEDVLTENEGDSSAVQQIYATDNNTKLSTKIHSLAIESNIDNPFHPEDHLKSIRTPSKAISSIDKRNKKQSMLRKTEKEISDSIDKENESFADGHISEDVLTESEGDSSAMQQFYETDNYTTLSTIIDSLAIKTNLDKPFHPEDKFKSIQTPSKVSSIDKPNKKHKSILAKITKEILDTLDKKNGNFSDGRVSEVVLTENEVDGSQMRKFQANYNNTNLSTKLDSLNIKVNYTKENVTLKNHGKAVIDAGIINRTKLKSMLRRFLIKSRKMTNNI